VVYRKNTALFLDKEWYTKIFHYFHDISGACFCNIQFERVQPIKLITICVVFALIDRPDVQL